MTFKFSVQIGNSTHIMYASGQTKAEAWNKIREVCANTFSRKPVLNWLDVVS